MESVPRPGRRTLVMNKTPNAQKLANSNKQIFGK